MHFENRQLDRGTISDHVSTIRDPKASPEAKHEAVLKLESSIIPEPIAGDLLVTIEQGRDAASCIAAAFAIQGSPFDSINSTLVRFLHNAPDISLVSAGLGLKTNNNDYVYKALTTVLESSASTHAKVAAIIALNGNIDARSINAICQYGLLTDDPSIQLACLFEFSLFNPATPQTEASLNRLMDRGDAQISSAAKYIRENAKFKGTDEHSKFQEDTLQNRCITMLRKPICNVLDISQGFIGKVSADTLLKNPDVSPEEDGPVIEITLD